MYGVNMTNLLNVGSDFTGTFQLDQTGKSNQELRNAADPGRTFLVVERAGVPIWDGNVTSRTYQSQAKSSQTWARSVAGYPDKIIMDETFIPNGFDLEADISDIFLALWELLQSKPECDQRVLLPSPLNTGVTRHIVVDANESKTFGDVMSEVADGDPGMDWRIVTIKQGTKYVRQLQFGFPTVGNPNAAGLVFDYPGAVMNYWKTEHVGDSGTHIHGHGSGTGENKITSLVVHQDRIDGGYLRWDQEIEFDQVADQAVLDALTLQEARNRKLPAAKFTVQVHGNNEPKFGTYLPGDACTLKINDAFHPGGQRFVSRIVGWKAVPASGEDVEVIDLYFAGSEFDA